MIGEQELASLIKDVGKMPMILALAIARAIIENYDVSDKSSGSSGLVGDPS